MKITHLAIVLATLCLGGAGLYYSLEQQKQYEIVVQMHGGGSQVDDANAQGLHKEELALTATKDIQTKERSDAIKASVSMKGLMLDKQASCNELNRQLIEANKKLEAAKKELTKVQIELKKITNAIAAAAEEASAQSFLQGIDADATLSDLVSIIKEEVDRLIAEQKELDTKKEELAILLSTNRDKVAREKAELADLLKRLAENRSYISENKDEYTIAAVDTTWNFVIINLGPNSSLGVGDNNQLLIKRDGNSIARLRVVSIDGGQAVADFDPEQLKYGQRIEVGDKAIRVKPFGD